MFKLLISSILIFLSLNQVINAQAISRRPPLVKFGVWELKSDSVIAWVRNPDTDINITFESIPSYRRAPLVPMIRFRLEDNSGGIAEYIRDDIFTSEYDLLIPVSFDLISTNWVTKGHRNSETSLSFRSDHKVYCEDDSTIDQLTFVYYSGAKTERKHRYIFDTKGLAEAIKYISCK